MSCPACGKDLPEDVTACPSCGFAPHREVQPFKPNEMLEGRYRIDAEVGRGGMGVVYRGTDLTLKRPVAIKAMRAADADPDVIARFMREAQALARVEHSGLVPVYAVGREGGAYYMVMKFIEGRSLSQILKSEGAMAPERVRLLLIQVCDALGGLHRAGLIHRDMKPGNLMLGDDGRVTVMDLGIVKTVGENTQTTSTALGTPRYMPPEMLNEVEIDGRADLYSLGVIAWHALVGRPPFDGATPMAILYKQAHEAAEPLRTAAPEVPRNLAAAVEKALAKDREARHADAEAFIEALSPDVVAAKGPGKTLIFVGLALLVAAGLAAFMLTRPGAPISVTADASRPVTSVGADAALRPDAAHKPLDASVAKDAAPVVKDAAVKIKVQDAAPKPKVKPKVMVAWRVTSSPSGASIYLRGRNLGRTPHTIRLPKAKGSVRLTLKRQGYEPAQARIKLGAGGRKHVRLEAIFELMP